MQTAKRAPKSWRAAELALVAVFLLCAILSTIATQTGLIIALDEGASGYYTSPALPAWTISVAISLILLYLLFEAISRKKGVSRFRRAAAFMMLAAVSGSFNFVAFYNSIVPAETAKGQALELEEYFRAASSAAGAQLRSQIEGLAESVAERKSAMEFEEIRQDRPGRGALYFREYKKYLEAQEALERAESAYALLLDIWKRAPLISGSEGHEAILFIARYYSSLLDELRESVAAYNVTFPKFVGPLLGKGRLRNREITVVAALRTVNQMLAGKASPYERSTLFAALILGFSLDLPLLIGVLFPARFRLIAKYAQMPKISRAGAAFERMFFEHESSRAMTSLLLAGAASVLGAAIFLINKTGGNLLSAAVAVVIAVLIAAKKENLAYRIRSGLFATTQHEVRIFLSFIKGELEEKGIDDDKQPPRLFGDREPAPSDHVVMAELEGA